MKDDQLIFMHETDEVIKSAIRRAIPNVEFSSWGNSGMNFSGNLSKNNKEYSETAYYYKGPLEFYHLTSLHLLPSILNERAFRFYDLNSSADPDEYSYAAATLDINPHRIDYRKKDLFTFSFCPISEINNPHVWEIYERASTGVAIVFEIVNDPNSWENFHMSEIQYSVPDTFHQLSKDLKGIEQTRRVGVDYDLSRLLGFHKKAHWIGEKEVRILTYSPFESMDEFQKYAKLEFRIEKERNRITHYFKLPLWVDNDSDLIKSIHPELNRVQNLPTPFFDTRPKIKIKDILFGAKCGLNEMEFEHFRFQIEILMQSNYGYRPNLSHKLFHPSP